MTLVHNLLLASLATVRALTHALILPYFMYLFPIGLELKLKFALWPRVEKRLKTVMAFFLVISIWHERVFLDTSSTILFFRNSFPANLIWWKFLSDSLVPLYPITDFNKAAPCQLLSFLYIFLGLFSGFHFRGIRDGCSSIRIYSMSL